MTFSIFPTLTGLAFPVKKSPTFQTIRHVAVAGQTTNQSPQPFAKYAYDLAFEFLRSDDVALELQQLKGFYESCRAMGSPFYFSDPDDGAAVGQGLGVGDGVTASFGFVRAEGNNVCPVQSAIEGTITVYVDGAPLIDGTDYTLLTTSQYGTKYGILFAVPPLAGHVITADFQYYWLCEFDEDNTEFQKFMYLDGKGLWSVASIKFSSVLQ